MHHTRCKTCHTLGCQQQQLPDMPSSAWSNPWSNSWSNPWSNSWSNPWSNSWSNLLRRPASAAPSGSIAPRGSSRQAGSRHGARQCREERLALACHAQHQGCQSCSKAKAAKPWQAPGVRELKRKADTSLSRTASGLSELQATQSAGQQWQVTGVKH
jgi:hypothetical protein